MRRLCGVFFIVFACLLMQACGYKLRGTSTASGKISHIAIINHSQDRSLHAYLEAQFRMLKIIPTIPSKSHYVLNIWDYKHSQSVAAISSSTNTRQFVLKQQLKFSVDNAQGKSVIPSNWIHSSRTLTVNSNQILGSDNQSLTLHHEMMRELVVKLTNELYKSIPK